MIVRRVLFVFSSEKLAYFDNVYICINVATISALGSQHFLAMIDYVITESIDNEGTLYSSYVMSDLLAAVEST